VAPLGEGDFLLREALDPLPDYFDACRSGVSVAVSREQKG
jgi:hypothetical protein